MRSSNPIFRNWQLHEAHSVTEKPMTVSGTINKLLILTLIMLVSASAVFYQFFMQRYDFVQIIMTVGIIVGFISVITLFFNPKISMYVAPIYAFAQGAVVSGISCFFEASYPGVVIKAISVTMLTVFSMAMLYKTKMIKVNDKFRFVLMSSVLAIFIFYLLSFVLMLFSINVPYFSSTSNLSIGINVVIAIVAAFCLLLDFNNIEEGSKLSVPAVYEWYCAYGLLATVIWLYVEILRLLVKLRDR